MDRAEVVQRLECLVLVLPVQGQLDLVAVQEVHLVEVPEVHLVAVVIKFKLFKVKIRPPFRWSFHFVLLKNLRKTNSNSLTYQKNKNRNVGRK
ncbi:MAG: hypothetical protein ABIR84_06245 [Candidatus Nitrotoga sp.]